MIGSVMKIMPVQVIQSMKTMLYTQQTRRMQLILATKTGNIQLKKMKPQI